MIATLLLAGIFGNPAPTISDFDVVWDSPSVDASGSMPIGNGEVVANVWVESATGDLLFYIARSDAISEISRILKLGMVRVHLEPRVDSSIFSQRLNLLDGTISIQQGERKLEFFVDSNSDSIVVQGGSKSPFSVTASVENWRTSARTLPQAEQRSAWSVHDAPFPLVESADVFLSRKNEVVWYHRNETSVVPQLWKNQSLEGLKGCFDPLLHRTFGAKIWGKNFVSASDHSLRTRTPLNQFDLQVTSHSEQTESVSKWQSDLDAKSKPVASSVQLKRTQKWWHDFWNNSFVVADEPSEGLTMPENSFPVRKGFDSNGQNVFPGTIENWAAYQGVVSPSDCSDPVKRQKLVPNPELKGAFTLSAWITPSELKPGRIFDKLTAGQSDGMLFDTHPGDSLRFGVGAETLIARQCLAINKRQHAVATFEPNSGQMAIFLDGKLVAQRAQPKGSLISRGYLLQRYTQAIQGRGKFPIKFNGGLGTVEPKASGMAWNADWRQWGDSHWFQNLRHMYHPMLASGDFSMMNPFFQLYENSRVLAESRTQKYHKAEGAYFPETMTFFGTYSGGDYGWDRTGLQPKDVQCPWWDDAWNQGPELVCLMLDYWDYSQDQKFLKSRLLPMAESVLKYFDTRFKKDSAGRIVLDPTQVVETYWEGVVNDMPAVSGLIAMCERLNSVPKPLLNQRQTEFFGHMQKACPELPFETGKLGKELAPAQAYKTNTSNVENGELYAVWPFRLITLQKPKYIEEAKRAYQSRSNRLDTGWGYDGNVASLLGMTDEAARILKIKCRNSNSAYRWPATWGPNFDWLPDQNHGGNLLNTTNTMLMQAQPMSSGGKILLFPAWPKNWDVHFKLHAPGKTTVECSLRGGKITMIQVVPASRRKDIELPNWAN